MTGRQCSAAIIIGFAVNPLTRVTFPEITATIAHLRDVLGEWSYESRISQGEAMTTAAMAKYAYDQIEQVRDAIAAGRSAAQQ